MASVYTNDLRLEEIGSGEQSGTWGDTTNTNLELIAEAFSFGTEAITTNADTHTTTIADGASDPGRSMFLKYTGTLDSACTITIAPNTVSKLWFIENGTSGSQNIIISQGSGANITIPPGDTKAIYSDGAGSGAAMVDAFASLSVVDLKVQDDLTVTDDLIVGGDIDLEGSIDVNGTANLDAVDIDGAVQIDNTVSVGVNDTGYDVKFFGDTASAFMLWDASADDLILGGAAGLSVNSAALVTGVLTTTAATVFNGGFASNAGSTVSNADNNATLELICTDTDAASGPRLDLYRNPGEAGADGDNLAQLNFYGLNDASEKSQYLYLFTEMADVANGSEDVRFLFGGLVAGADSSLIEFTHGTPATGADPELVFNNTSRDINFRVESDGNANALFVDGGGKSTGINVVPAASYAPSLAIGFGGNNITSRGNVDLRIFSGAFQDGASTFQYAVSSLPVSMLSMTNGGFAVQSAPAGTDGNAATFTTKFYVDPDGTISTPTLGTSNVRFGVNAGDAIASGGNYNTVVGDEAGTAISTGDLHTFIGYGAGDAVSTEATGLTAVGANALTANTSGTDNLAIGVSALESCTEGIGNVVVGRYAAADLVDADGNVAIGAFDGTVQPAMRLNTKSHDNVAVGAGALAAHNLTDNSSGGNVAVGYSAGLIVSTGIQNTLIGGFAGDAITGGSQNTLVGYNAGGATTGTFNAFYGRSSGSAMTSGDKNTILGSFNGNQGGLNIAAEDNNVVLSDGDGNIILSYQSTGNTTKMQYLYSNTTSDAANLTVLSSGTVARSTSSLRYKRDVSDATHGLSDVLNLRPVTYKGTGIEDGDTVFGGLIAEEVHAAGLTEFVAYDTQDRPDALRYGNMVSLCIKAIQEQQATITALTDRITALEG